MEDIEGILKEWISERTCREQEEIEKCKAEGLVDNVLVDSMIDPKLKPPHDVVEQQKQ